MKTRDYRFFVGDFETTVFKGQTFTEVWASALVELNTEDVIIHHSISDTFNYLKDMKENICIYYHNLKFDGAFWIDYLLSKLNFKQAYTPIGNRDIDIEWLPEKKMLNNTFKYSISDMGQWYTITIKVNNHIIQLRDSLKLLPFSVERIGKAFGTKHKKLNMEYEGFRYAGCEITNKEKEYIANDVLIVKEALEIMFNEGHNSLTIGACCLTEFKKITGKMDWNIYYPDLSELYIDNTQHTYATADEWVRKSYRGGWCYVVKGKEHLIHTNGITCDVNSLYPSMMSSESGNRFPIGKPKFWKGDYIPDEALKNNRYYFIRLKTRFYIRKNKLPFIQIKNTLRYNGNECLTSSDLVDKDGNHFANYLDIDGEVKDTRVELTMTMTDYELFKEHYHLIDCEIIDGCWFESAIGLFDEYIERYKKIKLTSKGAKRELAKLFLNNLYGKMASSNNSSFKFAFVNENNAISFKLIHENNKKVGYIPIGSAITSYARNFTIRAAQKNYYGVNKRGFIYADTDSIHCDIPIEQVKGIKIHDKDFCCWKVETYWDKAIFTRQKTYIEHITHEDMQPISKPYYNVKCAGMPTRCKELFLLSLQGYTPEQYEKLNDEEKEFVKQKRTLEDFTVGLCIPSKLMPKRIQGGVLLVPTTYEMR